VCELISGESANPPAAAAVVARAQADPLWALAAPALGPNWHAAYIIAKNTSSSPAASIRP